MPNWKIHMYLNIYMSKWKLCSYAAPWKRFYIIVYKFNRSIRMRQVVRVDIDNFLMTYRTRSLCFLCGINFIHFRLLWFCGSVSILSWDGVPYLVGDFIFHSYLTKLRICYHNLLLHRERNMTGNDVFKSNEIYIFNYSQRKMSFVVHLGKWISPRHQFFFLTKGTRMSDLLLILFSKMLYLLFCWSSLNFTPWFCKWCLTPRGILKTSLLNYIKFSEKHKNKS